VWCVRTSPRPWPPLLHGFDSSCLEYRRLFPLLAERAETWAVDLLGWGFTDAGDAGIGGGGAGTDGERGSGWGRKRNARPVCIVRGERRPRCSRPHTTLA